MTHSHVSQSASAWIPNISGQTPPTQSYDAASFWVGGSGLFSHTELLEQTGIWEDAWEYTAGTWYYDTELFWECVDHTTTTGPCQSAHNIPLMDPHWGDLITMYTSGNYHFIENSRNGLVDDSNNGPLPLEDSSEWITERPVIAGSWRALANFFNVGWVRMQWMDELGQIHTSLDDTDLISYLMSDNNGPTGTIDAYPNLPYWNGSYWQESESTVFWARD